MNPRTVTQSPVTTGASVFAMKEFNSLVYYTNFRPTLTIHVSLNNWILLNLNWNNKVNNIPLRNVFVGNNHAFVDKQNIPYLFNHGYTNRQTDIATLYG